MIFVFIPNETRIPIKEGRHCLLDAGAEFLHSHTVGLKPLASIALRASWWLHCRKHWDDLQYWGQLYGLLEADSSLIGKIFLNSQNPLSCINGTNLITYRSAHRCLGKLIMHFASPLGGEHSNSDIESGQPLTVMYFAEQDQPGSKGLSVDSSSTCTSPGWDFFDDRTRKQSRHRLISSSDLRSILKTSEVFLNSHFALSWQAHQCRAPLWSRMCRIHFLKGKIKMHDCSIIYFVSVNTRQVLTSPGRTYKCESWCDLKSELPLATSAVRYFHADALIQLQTRGTCAKSQAASNLYRDKSICDDMSSCLSCSMPSCQSLNSTL